MIARVSGDMTTEHKPPTECCRRSEQQKQPRQQGVLSGRRKKLNNVPNGADGADESNHCSDGPRHATSVRLRSTHERIGGDESD
jgi:hypothetical protein